MAFTEEIMSLLHDYKRALKRYMSPEARNIKINMLGLDRKSIKNADEVTLYHKGQAVITDIKSWLEKNNDSAAMYSGIEEYCNHLTEFLEQFHIEEDRNKQDKVVHTQQLVSRAMVDAIQLLNLPSEKLLGQRNQHLDSCLQTIAKYGNKEQQDILFKAIKARKERHQQIITPLLNSFRNYMQTKMVLIEQY